MDGGETTVDKWQRGAQRRRRICNVGGSNRDGGAIISSLGGTSLELGFASLLSSSFLQKRREKKRKRWGKASPAQPKIIVCKYGTAHKNYADVFSANIRSRSGYSQSNHHIRPNNYFLFQNKKNFPNKFFVLLEQLKIVPK